MNGLLESILASRKLVYTLVGVFSLAGLVAFQSMDRQEDPSFPYRVGQIITQFPGADPERVERLVLEPLEEQLAQVEEIDDMDSVARQGVAVTRIILKDSIYDTASAWDRVRIKMDRAVRDFPDSARPPQLNDRVIGGSTIVYAITGSTDLDALAKAADRLKKRLLGMQNMASIDIFGDPGEQITVAVEDAVMARVGLTPQALVSEIQSSNQIISGGSLRLAGASVNLKPGTDFRTLDEIRTTPIRLPAGESIPLGSFAQVFHSTAQPPTQRMWFDGRPAVGLELKAERDSTNVVAFGERVRTRVADLRDEFAPLQIEEMFYQPAHTESRLATLLQSLLVSVAIIVAVLFAAMGLRMGILVATLLPLVTLTAVAIYAIGGGVLQQMAIFGMVVSLGILVDNAIVMTENVQWHLNRGESPGQAALKSVRELAGPLFAATGTTLAAFVPLLLAEGGTGDFTRAIPIMIMLALIISYIFAVTLTPMLAQTFLRAGAGSASETGRFARLASRLAYLTTTYRKSFVVGGFLVMGASFFCMQFLEQEFFPNADRNQVVIDMTLAEGSHLQTTEAAARRIELALRGQPGVESVHAFIGNSGPTFYYNLPQIPESPQRARLVVQTDGLARNREIIDWVDDFAGRELPQADIVGGILRQGPPLSAPIEVRVFNEDPQRLAEATERVYDELIRIPGVRDARHNLGTGVPSVDYRIHDAVARRYGVTRADIAQALLGRSHGITIGQYRAGDDPVPIKLRSPEGERFDLAELETANIYAPNGSFVPLLQVAEPVLEMQPGAIYHYDQRRLARVYSELAPDTVYSEVLGPVKSRLKALALPPGTDIEYGGEAEESAKANNAIASTAPLGVALLMFFLLMEFNSFRRVGLVLMTLPFALAGVIPGLWLLGFPFGFLPLLGAIALVGIVVNNAIVLIDVLDQRLAEGLPLIDAMREAVERRTRPILLTTATTIAGLLPLAFSSATLWPPMAWAIITGLLASTVLTLLVLPAMCCLVLGGRRPAGGQPAAAAVVLMLAGGLLAASPAPVHAETMPADTPVIDYNEATLAGSSRPRVQAEGHRASAAQARARAEFRRGAFPRLQGRAFADRVDERPSIEVPNPAGPGTREFEVGELERRGATIELRQPLFDAAQQLYAAPSARQSAVSAGENFASSKLAGAVSASDAYVDAAVLRERLESVEDLLSSLEARNRRINELADQGRALKSDRLEVRFALDRALQSRAQLREEYHVAQAVLARAAGRDGRVIPAVMDYRPPAEDRSVQQLLAYARDRRRDLAALDAGIEAARLQAGAAGASRLPTVDAVASLQYNEGNGFAPDREGRLAAELRWAPFSGGVASAEKAEALAEVERLKAERLEFLREIRLQIENAVAGMTTARTLSSLARSGMASAEATLNARSARFEAGRATVDDVLDAEAELSSQRARSEIARYEILRHWARLQGALANSEWVTRLPADAAAPAGDD